MTKRTRLAAAEASPDWKPPDPRTTPTLSLDEARKPLDIGKSLAYELVARGEFPVPIIRCGKLIRVPTAPLLELLGLRSGADTPDAA